MIYVGVALQITVDLLLVVEVVRQRGVQLRLRKVRETLKNLIRRHAELIIASDNAHRDARAFDDRHAVRNS